MPGVCPECGREIPELQTCPGCGGDRLIRGMMGWGLRFSPLRQVKRGFFARNRPDPRVFHAACRDCGLISTFCVLEQLEAYLDERGPDDGG